MLLGVTAVAVATCFCLGPTPLPEELPMEPQASTTRVEVPDDAIPQRCLAGVRSWARTSPALCPRMPSQALHTKRVKSVLVSRAF